MEWWVPYKINSQEWWDNFISVNIDNNTNDLVFNRCILNEVHECALWKFEFAEFKNFKEFEKIIKNTEYCPGWYENKFSDEDFE